MAVSCVSVVGVCVVGCESEVFIIISQWMLVPVWYKEFLVLGSLFIMKNSEEGGTGFIQTIGVKCYRLLSHTECCWCDCQEPCNFHETGLLLHYWQLQ